jgi:RHS repeat-associated protein
MTQIAPRQSGNATYNFYFSGYRNTEEDPDGGLTVYRFDGKKRLVATEDALGNTAASVYDGQDHVIESTDPRGNTTVYEYDGNNNLTGVIDAYQNETEYDYDSQFRKTDAYNPLGHRTHYDYDAEHHLTGTIVYPDGSTQIETSATYYANGLTHTATDGRNVVTTMTYDSYGNVDTSQTGTQPVVDYDYDAIGRMQTLTDPVGSTTAFDYDDRGLLETRTDPLLKTAAFTYYDDGRVHTVTDRNGDVITTTYTPSGKTDTVAFTDNGGGPSFQVGYGYDIRDNLRTMTDTLGTTQYDYDAANRLTDVTDPHGFAVGYGYDEAGNLTTLTYPGGNTVTYTYDALNRLETVSIGWLGQTATYYYDDAGRVTDLAQFNGTGVSFGYDDADRLTSLENRKSDTSAIATYGFTLDANGNRKDVDVVEPLDMVVSGADISYGYNAEKNRLLTAGATGFSYDDEGQLSDKGGVAHVFDAAHRLVSTAGATPCQYAYDGSNNRLQATRNGVVTRYIYSASGQLLAEADENNTVLRYYIYGKGLTAMVTAGGQVYCYHFDANANTIAMTDSGQNIVNAYAYTPFGLIANEQEAVVNPFKFVGQFGVMTEPNGLYYMKARYYDPEVGRFISEDPLGFDGGDINLYVYAQNNPVNFTDPLGLKTWQIGLGLNEGGIVGSTKSAGIIIGHNPNTGDWDFGFYATGGAGPYGGASASLTLDITTSDNPCIDDVSGWAGTAGGSVGEFFTGGYERNTQVSGALPSNTYSVGVGGGTPAEGHGFATYTKVWGSNK